MSAPAASSTVTPNKGKGPQHEPVQQLVDVVHREAEPKVFDAGQATVPYPPLGRKELAEFYRCEEYLLREIVEARSWGRQVDARGVAFPTNGCSSCRAGCTRR